METDEGCGPPPAKKMALDFEVNEMCTPTDKDTQEMEKIKQAHKEQVSTLKKKLKSSQQKTRRLKKRNATLKGIVKQLKERDLISSSCEEMLQRNFSGVLIELFKRMSANSGKGCKYSPQLKSFALTLQFYSAKAYDFVRKTFNLALPHPVQIRKWYTKVPAEPGFTKASFQALAQKKKDAGKKVIGSLMIDEMAIRKHVSWDREKYRGYVDLGNDVEDDDSAPIAKDALVFMVVGVNESWKVPVAYFFIDGLSGKERANLIKVCLKKLHDVGIDIISLICDGPSCHFAMLRALGAHLNLPNIRPYFLHPLDKQKKIHIFLDVCHMLRLIRNTLGDGGILLDKDGNKICWAYLIELQKLQEKEGLRLGNKLKLSHIQWWQQKMKVNLAAQTFSASVADAIDYCRDTLKLPQFQGSEATVKFIRTFDHLFDILNSRNLCARGFKAALRKSNKSSWEPFIDEAREYIIGLKNTLGDPMYTTRRKTGFVGFLVAIDSIKSIFFDLVEKEEAPMNYILTYKFSQDHLELFFGAIRSSGGFNNNPTAEQFTAAYKRLLLRSSIQGQNGNCTKQDETDILEVIGDSYKAKNTESNVTINEAAIIRKYDLQGTNQSQDDDSDYSDAPSFSNVSEFKSAAISYIAGYVAQMVQKKTTCCVCHEAVGSREHRCESAFLTLKDRGNLFKPAASVISVCTETERCFQRMLASTNGRLPQGKGIPDAIVVSVLNSIDIRATFKELDGHMLNTTVTDNHVFTLIKTISKCYCKVRLYQLGKTTTEMATKTKVRKKLSKLVLFEHQ